MLRTHRFRDFNLAKAVSLMALILLGLCASQVSATPEKPGARDPEHRAFVLQAYDFNPQTAFLPGGDLAADRALGRVESAWRMQGETLCPSPPFGISGFACPPVVAEPDAVQLTGLSHVLTPVARVRRP